MQTSQPSHFFYIKVPVLRQESERACIFVDFASVYEFSIGILELFQLCVSFFLMLLHYIENVLSIVKMI